MNQNIFSSQSPTATFTTSATPSTASTPLPLPSGKNIKLVGKPSNTDVVIVNITKSPGTNAAALSGTFSNQIVLLQGEISVYDLPALGLQPDAASQLYFSTISATASQVIYISVGDGI